MIRTVKKNRKQFYVTVAVCVAAFWAGAASAWSAVEPDIVVLKQGDSSREYVVTGETWRDVQVLRIADGRKSTLPQAGVARVDYSDVPERYSLAITNIGRSRWLAAAADLEQALKNYDSGKNRSWIRQYALYHLAECRRVLAELAADTAALREAADTYAQLLRDVPDTKFKHAAMLAGARCALKIAEMTEDEEARATAAKEAEAAYTALARAAAGDFKGEEYAKAREIWQRRARLGRAALDCILAGGAEEMRKAAGEARGLASGADSSETGMEAMIWACRCELAAGRMDGTDDASALETTRQVIKGIVASVRDENARNRLLVLAYSVIGGHYYELMNETARDDPARRNYGDEAALAYLRVALLYPSTSGAEAECQDAIYRTALIMRERGEFRLAGKLLLIMKQKYADSALWKNTGSKMLAELPG